MAIAPRTAEELLRDTPVLQTLAERDLRKLAQSAEVRKVSAGAPLFTDSQDSEGLFVVRTGEFKVVTGAKDGREQILYLARAGKPIVEGVRFDGGRYSATAVAMRSSSAVLLTNRAIAEVGEGSPQVLRAMLDLRARRADRFKAL